jgi:hypothetical protein
MQVVGEAASDVPESVRLQGATPLRRVQAALACGESQLDDAAVAHAIAKVLAPAVCSSTSTSSNTSSSSSSSAELKRFAAHFVLQARRQFPECMQESAATATATAADANSGSGSDSDSAATGSDSGTDANAEDRKMRKKAYEAADDILCAYIDHLRYCAHHH